MKKLFVLLPLMILLGAACQRRPMILTAMNGTREQISYLEAHIEKANFGGKMFCQYAQIPMQQGDVIPVNTEYWWVTCQEYYRDQGTLREGTGVSLPVVAKLNPSNGSVVAVEQPSSVGYTDNIRRLFPTDMAQLILDPGCVFSPDLLPVAQQYFDQRPQ